MTEKHHLAAVRHHESRKEIDECCLSRAIGADETENFAGIEVKTNIVQGTEAPEHFGEVGALKDYHLSLSSAVEPKRLLNTPTIPFRMNRMVTISNAP